MKDKVGNNTDGNKYIKRFSLNPVGYVHIGVSPGFYIPYKPDNGWNNDH